MPPYSPVLEGKASSNSCNSGCCTVTEALDGVAGEQQRGFTFYSAELVPRVWPYQDFVREARRQGRYFLSLGFTPGARVGLLVAECADFVLAFFGLISAGIVPVPLALPFGPKQRGYAETVGAILNSAEAVALVMSDSLVPLFDGIRSTAPSLREPLRVQEVRDNQQHGFEEFALYLAQPNDTCFLQFTSGSTSKPKGVIVTHANLIANATAVMHQQLQANPERDVVLSWLPLHHDMGLIGCVCFPLMTGVSAVLFPTAAFIWRIGSWMQLVHAHRATITFAPNFAYALAAQRQKNVAELDLRCLRVAGCGAEPISTETLRRFAATFAAAGLRPEALMPAYGMAEHTLAATFESWDEPLRSLRVDRARYELDGSVQLLKENSEERALEIVSCGRPFEGHQLAIMAPDGALLASDQVGEIVLRGASATRGYYGQEDATAELWAHGWLHTGDLGFVHEGNLYVSGRLKDVIIINGKNYYPQDVEWELESIPGLRRGGVAAFGVDFDGVERIVIVAEAKSLSAAEGLRKTLEEKVTSLIGLPPGEIALVAPTVIPKTSSGKVQRRKLRAMFLDGSLLEESERLRPPPGRAPTRE